MSKRIAVATLHTENYRELAEITTYRNKKEYCEKHGYDLKIKVEPFSHSLGFERLFFVLDLLNSDLYKWIWHVGCDTLVMNFATKIEDKIDKAFDFIIAKDIHDINDDSFLIKNSPNSKRWLDKICSLEQGYLKHPWAEQQAIIDNLIDLGKEKLKIVPQRELNSYLYDSGLYPGMERHIGQYQPGDWLMHWPGLGLKTRIDLAKKYINLVVGNEQSKQTEIKTNDQPPEVFKL